MTLLAYLVENLSAFEKFINQILSNKKKREYIIKSSQFEDISGSTSHLIAPIIGDYIVQHE